MLEIQSLSGAIARYRDYYTIATSMSSYDKCMPQDPKDRGVPWGFTDIHNRQRSDTAADEWEKDEVVCLLYVCRYKGHP